ncbi:hypothetical protein LY474_15445 [Myxococcus stipitatus]|uniref:hypothetical protein n=1 Tax=Myxococcus stipitatus TaxID=83455 RepID=UPI001F3EAF0D|nr:hypothetical protein [Myxococcus stipitatus]MCE9669205.1 hypothetical protein [Myxococcus stipitatus]
MRSPNRVVASSVTLALCALLMGACGGSPGADESGEPGGPVTGGLEEMPSTEGEASGNGGNKSDESEGDAFTQFKVTLCHIPPGNPANAHTITVGAPALKAHVKHGDTLGACDGEPDGGSGEPDGGSGEPDGGSGEPDAGSGNPDGGSGPTCTPAGEACDESTVCCTGLSCSPEGLCEPEIN